MRLKGGDPFVFGRGGEEAQALAAAGIPFVVVPGITSAIAAPAYAGIPVTHRGVATSFTVVTGHEDPASRREQTDWAALAARPRDDRDPHGHGAPGGRSPRPWSPAAAPPDEPAAAVQWGTTARQRSVVATLGTLAERAGDQGVGSPAVVVVGAVAALAADDRLARARPLLGAARGRHAGARPGQRAVGAPARPRGDRDRAPDHPHRAPARRAGPGVGDRGARRLRAGGPDERERRRRPLRRDRRPRPRRPGAVGRRHRRGDRPGHRRAPGRRGVRADVVPERFVAEGILEALADLPLAGRARAGRPRAGSRPELVDGLARLGARVDELVLYEAVAEPAEPGDVGAGPRRRLPHLHRVLHRARLPRAAQRRRSGAARRRRPAGRVDRPVTSATAREEGLRVHAEAAEHTIPGLVSALLADAGAPVG